MMNCLTEVRTNPRRVTKEVVKSLQLSSSQEVATTRVAEALAAKFVAFDTPYLLAWEDGKERRWNLNVFKSIQTEGQPVDISQNGVQKWKIVSNPK